MPVQKQFARSAAYAALRLRYRAGIALTDPASPIDIAEKVGIQVWFLKAPSMEGMFVQAPDPQILLSSLRPAGRINFTCAHELGHHWFGHGAHVDLETHDEGLLTADAEDEFQANSFASALLMPKTTVQHGFVKRKTSPTEASPRQILAVAHWLGVGYTTLIHHLQKTLHLVGDDRAVELLKKQPRRIIERELDRAVDGSVFIVDRAWVAKPIDLQVGDVAIVEGNVETTGSCVRIRAALDTATLVEAVNPGTGHVDGGAGWSTYIRVRRFEFEGRSIFRHLEEEANGDG